MSDYTQLAQITAVVLAVRQKELQQQQRAYDRLTRQFEELDQQRAARARHRVAEHDSALVAGADLDWERWIEDRKRLINNEKATLASRMDRTRDMLRREFGRDHVAQSLANSSGRRR